MWRILRIAILLFALAIATYSMRFGGKSAAHTIPLPPTTDQPNTPRTPENVRQGESQ